MRKMSCLKSPGFQDDSSNSSFNKEDFWMIRIRDLFSYPNILVGYGVRFLIKISCRNYPKIRSHENHHYLCRPVVQAFKS